MTDYKPSQATMNAVAMRLGAPDASSLISIMPESGKCHFLLTCQLYDERDRLLAALTPDGDTKAAYIGEVRDDVITTIQGEDGEWEEVNLKPYVSWTAIKDIMALIRKEGGL